MSELTIIIPYRNREEHLREFLPAICYYLPGARIVVVEQADDKPFNRGKLINVGFLEAEQPDFFIAHDVDMIPLQVDYSRELGVTQLAGSDIQTYNYLGGVTMFDAKVFRYLGGYHNDYFHRAEDNEMFFNMQRRKVGIRQKYGTFRSLPHERTGPEFIPHLWVKSQQPRKVQDQLSACEYEVLSHAGEGVHNSNGQGSYLCETIRVRL